MAEPAERCEPQIIGRYALYDEIAAGGMATVHLGRLLGAAGFSRVVAIKRLHRHFAKNPEFVAMFVDEARLAARIRHPNVVPTLDVVRTADELFLVMEYVNGESLSQLMKVVHRRQIRVAPGIAASVAMGMLHGLHAAHTAHGEQGEPLEIVHRDVSPQNVIVGTDGIARVLDFGIAKARVRVQTTREGQIKGKLGYIAPEQLRSMPVGPFTDVYAASVVLWEMLACRRLFEADDEASLFMQVLNGASQPPSAHTKGLPRALDDAVMRGLSLDPSERFATAKEMATAIERACRPASLQAVGEWVEWLAKDLLQERTGRISVIESQSEIKDLADVVTPIQGVPPGLPPGVLAPPAARPVDPRAEAPSSSDVLPTVITGSSALPPAAPGDQPAASAPLPVHHGRRLVVALVVLVVSLLAVIAFMATRSSGDSSGLAATSEPAGSASRPIGSGASGPDVASGPRADSAADGGAEATPGSRASATAASSAMPLGATAAQATSRATSKPPGTPTTARPPVTSRVDCSTPYVVDRDGIRHVRPECVQ